MAPARIAYISFDTVPAPKGAATHIEAFARALGAGFGGVELVTVAEGLESVMCCERWPGVFHTELPAMGESLIDRVLCFRRFLELWLRGREFEAIQFRSIFEGLPLVELARGAKLVFEVNGLPSIELKYRYPGMEDDRELMRKILVQERVCLEAAEVVITPSGVTAGYLRSERGVDDLKIRVIPNGVWAGCQPAAGCHPAPQMRMIYFGTLSPWQGVELGIRALAQVRASHAATLTIIGTGSGREMDSLMALATKLGVGSAVTVLPAMSQDELSGHLRDSDVVLAPLALNDRNVVQGCCPLKILEGMAAGVPVIASDLPVVRELGCDGVHFLLVKPGSVDQIAQAALRLAADRELAAKIGEQGRAHVLANYTWERAGQALITAYEEAGLKSTEGGGVPGRS
ncbi:MAG TPA: glycosyltransferase family 4 protein [Bryobacteraceae bacterium]|nr:glycosyltransferase family 4 protein [Bryobacteraceae bacterium]